MSVLGIAGSGLFGYLTQNLGAGNGATNFRQEFQQLGQELQAGNLAAAQSEFGTLQQGVSQTRSAAQSSGSIAQALGKLSQDLQSGNLTEAQSDYSTLQQHIQTQAASTHGHHRHHHGGSAENSGSAVSQLFNELGSALQAGNLSTAQQAYSSLQQDLTGMSGVSFSA